MFAETVMGELQRYMVQRDEKALQTAIARIQEELDNPSLVEAVIEPIMTMADIGILTAEKPVLRLREGMYKPLGFVLQADKFVRVKPTDAGDSTVLIMLVAGVQANEITLVPVTV